MQRITAALDSVFAGTADKFYDDLYGGRGEEGPTEYTRASHWENIPTESEFNEHLGVTGKYGITPAQHKMLYDWEGPNGEKVEFWPDQGGRTARYFVTHEVPGRGSKRHTILPPVNYDAPEELGHLDRSHWQHSYTWSDAGQQHGSGIVESYWPSHKEVDPNNGGSVEKILESIGRINSGEPVDSVYPPREGEHWGVR